MQRSSVLAVDKTHALFLILDNADGFDARLDARLVERKTMENEEWQRLRESEKLDSRGGDHHAGGRNSGSAAIGSSGPRSGFSARSSITDAENAEETHALQKFAKDLVHEIEEFVGREHSDQLILVAGPDMLGVLRPALSARLGARVKLAEVHKSVCGLKLHEIHDMLAKQHLLPQRSRHAGSGAASNAAGRP